MRCGSESAADCADASPCCADDVLLRVLRDLCARDLAALTATCRRFTSPAADTTGDDTLSVPEVAALARCLRAGWPARRVCASWVIALRLTECHPALPSGSRDDLAPSAHAATLTQADRDGRPPPPPGAPCAGCGLRGNVWLNLSTGAVLCGRRQFDGSGGNACALQHAGQEALRGSSAPLVVKLGTISADLRAGVLRADVFSYAERSAVADPLLPQHLAHWGVDAAGGAHPRAPSVADLCADVDARHAAAVAAWFALPVEDVPTLLRSLTEAQRQHLMALFAHASRQMFAAQREAQRAAAQAEPAGHPQPPPPPQPLPVPQVLVHGEAPDVAELAAQMAAMAADEQEWAVFDAAELAAADLAAADSEEE